MIPVRSGLLAIATLLAPGAALAQEGGGAAAAVQAWVQSAHGDAAAEAFAHWNGEDEVPAACAVCHSGAGFRDFHGLDGTAMGSVDQTIAPGGVVDCDTCHVEGAAAISEVTFPSGITVAALPNAGTCLTCHQGRASGSGLRASFGDADPDGVNPDLRFQNPHYAAAGATTFGSEVAGLYEYLGQSYDGRFSHTGPITTCSSCHDPHSLEVRTEGCLTCHENGDPATIRISRIDYDGDGDVTEGIAAEVEGLRQLLAAEIAAYAAEVGGGPIVYGPGRYPYFFADTNGNGTLEDDEANRGNGYVGWTPRLLAAAYNFQFVTGDPGGFAHNPNYTLQALHDSIMDLAEAAGRPGPAISRP
jgi:hypothetical protein